MQFLKKIEEKAGDTIVVSLPEEFRNKTVEIMIFPLREKKNDFKSLGAISVNTKDFRFNREEFHER